MRQRMSSKIHKLNEALSSPSMILKYLIAAVVLANRVKYSIIVGLLLEKEKQICCLHEIIEDYKRREAKFTDENIHIKQSMHITVGEKESSASPNLLKDNRKAEEEITIFNLKIEKLTRDNQKLRNSSENLIRT